MNVRRAVSAGIAGGIVVDLFLFITRSMPFPGAYQFIASLAVGPVAFTSSGYILLGLVLHFFVSIVAALVYEAVAERVPALIDQPFVWGAVFGVGVMIVMQIVLAVGRAAQAPTVTSIAMGLIAHIVFFGIPVAWMIARTEKRQTLAV